MGLSDFKIDYTSTIVSQLLEWFPRPLHNVSTLVEQDLFPLDLRAIIWGHDTSYKSLTTLSPLTRAALQVWYCRRECYSPSSNPSHPEATSLSINWLTKFCLSNYCKWLFASGEVHRPLREFERLCLLPEVPSNL